MANIFDYIEWRGDLKFTEAPFNEIDNLILSRISYLPFSSIIENDEIITIKEAYKRFKKLDMSNVRILLKEDLELFPAIANSTRFGMLYLKKFISKFDAKEEKQFSAITIVLPDGEIYVSYRGTDNTLVGWKEDFNMTFMQSIPAQKDAKDYLNNIANQTVGNIRVGGHSKGGNLAVFASAFCEESVKNRIIDVYNNDGPGFSEEILKSQNYNEILPKIHTYLPQSSIIGRLLNHSEKYTVVKSTQVGIYQHDLYSWQVLGPKFVALKSLTKESEFIDKTLKNWLNTVEKEEREKFWMTMFEILESTDAETLSEINENKFTNYKKIFNSYKNLDDESKNIINQTIKSLMSIVKENIKNEKTNKNLEKDEDK